MGKWTQQNYDELKDCLDGIKELVREENLNAEFLDHTLFQLSLLEQYIKDYRKQISKPQLKK